MLRLLAKLGDLDVRWLYAALLTGIVLSAFSKTPLKMTLSPEAKGYYETIQNINSPKPVLIQSDWDQNTVGELKAQFINTIKHLFRENIRFVIVSGNPVSPRFNHPTIQAIAQEYGKTYGKDWVDFGFKLADPKAIAIESLSRNFHNTVRTDRLGKKPTEYEWLKNVHTAQDWALVISISYSEFREYLTYFYETYRTPYICGLTSITSTSLYPFVTAKTLKGMLVGSRGGAEYEQAVAQSGYATRFLLGQTTGHLLLIASVLLGNIGYFAKKKLDKLQTKQRT